MRCPSNTQRAMHNVTWKKQLFFLRQRPQRDQPQNAENHQRMEEQRHKPPYWGINHRPTLATPKSTSLVTANSPFPTKTQKLSVVSAVTTSKWAAKRSYHPKTKSVCILSCHLVVFHANSHCGAFETAWKIISLRNYQISAATASVTPFIGNTDETLWSFSPTASDYSLSYHAATDPWCLYLWF